MLGKDFLVLLPSPPHANYGWGRKIVVQSSWIVLWCHLKYGGCFKTTCCERKKTVEKGESVAGFLMSEKNSKKDDVSSRH